MRRLLRIVAILLLAPPLIASTLGSLVAPSFLYPIRRPLTPDLIQQAFRVPPARPGLFRSYSETN